MKVGVWGWFHTGNYGDELMALYVAAALRELGVEPIVFDLRPEVAERHGLATTPDLEAFFAGSAFVVFAEGGCLVDAGDGFNEKGERYENLIRAARRHRVRLYPLSIGGNGIGAGARPKGGIERLWREGVCGEAVVRLPGDVALVESFGGRAAFVPDMLWEVAEVLGVEASPRAAGPERPIRIGLNVLRRFVPDDFAEQVSASVPDGVEVTWLAVHTEDRVKGELRAEAGDPRVRVFRHRDPLELLRFVGELDLLVSSKLHVGLTTLGGGTPFVSCHGRPKTAAQLALVSRAPGLVREDGMAAVVDECFSDPGGFVERVRACVDWEAVDRCRRESAVNRKWLARWVARHRGGWAAVKAWLQRAPG